MSIRNYRQVRKGIFKPKKINDLKPSAEQFIGKEMELSYLWVCDKNENFAGQVAWQFPDEVGRVLNCYWAPDEDFEWIE